MKIDNLEGLRGMEYERRKFEEEVQYMLSRGVHKSDIARYFMVNVHEITKVQKGKTEDIVKKEFYNKNRKLAMKIYWECYFSKRQVDHEIAQKYGVELWVAEELYKLFKQSLTVEVKL